MTTCLGKSCSFGLPRVPFVNCCQFIYLVRFLFGFEGRTCDLIVSVPDHCLSFYFDIVNFPSLDANIPRATSYGVYLSQLFWVARVSSHVADVNTRNQVFIAKLLKQGYRYHKLHIVAILKFLCRLVFEFNAPIIRKDRSGSI